jgi:hypothetical protein
VNKKAKILFFCMIFVASHAFSQKTLPLGTIQPGVISPLFKKFPVTKQQNIFLLSTTMPVKRPMSDSIKNPSSFTVISPNFYAQNLAFFCKKELQFEKATKINFKFRLGSVQYTDWLEGKSRTKNY